MKVLLDTHALLWVLDDNPRLSPRAIELIAGSGYDKIVSAVSAYEICYKHRLGKLPEAEMLAADFPGQMALLAFEWLPVSPAHAMAAGTLDPSHRDPFDRLLAGQARVEQMPILSVDTAFDRLGVERVW